MADETAAIQPYMPDDTVNSICHAIHISENIKDFEHYFPEVKYYHEKIRTKCRFSTSIPIKEIKSKIWAELRKYNFWMEPTQIKCHETARCGFFLYAHPVFTYRHDFVEILTPILLQQISNGPDFEYDVQPEKLTVTAGIGKFNEKVLMLRTTPTYCEEVQGILTTLFSDTNETNIHTLRKYVFVPINIAGDHTKSTLQGLVRAQHNFRSNVYHYIVTNIQEFHKQYQIATPAREIDHEMQDTTNDESNGVEQHNSNNTVDNKDTGATTSEQNKSDNQTEAYSMREWLYDLQDDNDEDLLHAAYPSADSGKIFVLCEKPKATKVLQLLHNIVELASQVFPDEAIRMYFGANKDLPLVQHHPRATAELSSYASRLATYAAVSNPQGDPEASTYSQQAQRGPKRTRDGGVRPQAQTYVAAAGQQSHYGADVGKLMTQLQSNLDTLKTVQDRQDATDDALQGIENRFQHIEGGLRGHGAILTTLSNTQQQQGKLLNTLNNKIDNLTGLTSRLSSIPSNQIQETQPNGPTTINEPNTSHGDPEGMES